MSDDLTTSIRYQAATAAALALSPRTKDEPRLDDAGRSALRHRAVQWLRDELSAWSKFAETGKREDLELASRAIESWVIDDDLKTLRDPEELAKMPKADREAFTALWSVASTVLARIAKQVAALEEAPKAEGGLLAIVAPPEGYESLLERADAPAETEPIDPNISRFSLIPSMENLTALSRRIGAANDSELALHAERCNQFVTKGQFEEAIAEGRAMVQLEPESSYAHHVLAYSLIQAEKPDDAIVELREAIRLDP